MRLRIAFVGLVLGASIGGLAHGCSDSVSDIENICGWVDDPNNCYRTMYLDMGAQCGHPGTQNDNFSAAPVGAFSDRTMLATCIIAGGGSVVFDPPLDLTRFPLGQPIPDPDGGPDGPPDTYNIKMYFADGTECGAARFNNAYDFGIGVDACPPGSGNIPPLGGGGATGVGGGFFLLTSASASSGSGGAGGAGGAGGGVVSSPMCNKDIMGAGGGPILAGQFSITQDGEFLDTTCADGETHHFDFYTASEKCTSQVPLIPHAEIDSSPGSTVALGFVKFRVFYPQVNVPDGGEPDPSQEQIVEYFNCSIPVAPPACADGMRNGAETDVDCGGPETTPGCPARCMVGQLCQTSTDCDPTTTCVEDGTTGVLKCTMAAAGAGGAGGATASSTGGAGGAGGTGGAGGH